MALAWHTAYLHRVDGKSFPSCDDLLRDNTPGREAEAAEVAKKRAEAKRRADVAVLQFKRAYGEAKKEARPADPGADLPASVRSRIKRR